MLTLFADPPTSTSTRNNAVACKNLHRGGRSRNILLRLKVPLLIHRRGFLFFNADTLNNFDLGGSMLLVLLLLCRVFAFARRLDFRVTL